MGTRVKEREGEREVSVLVCHENYGCFIVSNEKKQTNTKIESLAQILFAV